MARRTNVCKVLWVLGVLFRFVLCLSVVFAAGSRPVPFRTRKLSLSAPMVLHSGGCGRVGRCRHEKFYMCVGESIRPPFFVCGGVCVLSHFFVLLVFVSGKQKVVVCGCVPSFVCCACACMGTTGGRQGVKKGVWGEWVAFLGDTPTRPACSCAARVCVGCVRVRAGGCVGVRE